MSKTTANRRLILLRHGKSSYPDGVPDHERPLAGRGRREAALAGDRIRAQGRPVDAVLCSTALRTRQTLLACAIVAPTTFAHEIYDAAVPAILACIAGVPDSVGTLLVVGHAPGMPATALALAGAGSNTAALRRLRESFPTSALAVLDLVGGWTELAQTGARLVDFDVPRG